MVLKLAGPACAGMAKKWNVHKIMNTFIMFLLKKYSNFGFIISYYVFGEYVVFIEPFLLAQERLFLILALVHWHNGLFMVLLFIGDFCSSEQFQTMECLI